MRKLYLFLVVSVCVIIILLVAAFLYIDTHRHNIFYYDVAINGMDTSTVKLDKYVTEDKIIYSSSTDTPFHSTCKMQKRKLVLDKQNLRISDYNKKALGDRVIMDIYLKRMDSSVSFLAIGHSNFAYLDKLGVDKDFILFEEDALVSYADITDRYDFKKKGLQRFQALTHSFAFLPPTRQPISLRFAGEKSIDLGGKKVDALHLILKLPDYKEASIWIKKWTHAILKVENPRINFKAVQTMTPKALVSKSHCLESPDYIKKDVSFKNKDVLLAGTLNIPKKAGRHPAVLLVWGPGPLDRKGLGMFTNLADYLASNGIAVLSFDKRGVGESQGNFSRLTRNDIIGDLQAALDFLIQHDRVDNTKIAVLGHSEGSFYASYLASTNQNVSACIIMAGMVVPNIYVTELETINYFNSVSPDWDKEYLADIARSSEQTMKIIQGGKDWILLSGKRVYLKKARLDLENKPLEIMRKLKTPVLILQGKKDTVVLPEHARLLEGALKEGGNQNHKFIFFEKLGHFFGDIVQDGVHPTRLNTDEKAMKAIETWLKDSLAPPPVQPAPESESEKM